MIWNTRVAPHPLPWYHVSMPDKDYVSYMLEPEHTAHVNPGNVVHARGVYSQALLVYGDDTGCTEGFLIAPDDVGASYAHVYYGYSTLSYAGRAGRRRRSR